MTTPIRPTVVMPFRRRPVRPGWSLADALRAVPWRQEEPLEEITVTAPRPPEPGEDSLRLLRSLGVVVPPTAPAPAPAPSRPPVPRPTMAQERPVVAADAASTPGGRREATIRDPGFTQPSQPGPDHVLVDERKAREAGLTGFTRRAALDDIILAALTSGRVLTPQMAAIHSREGGGGLRAPSSTVLENVRVGWDEQNWQGRAEVEDPRPGWQMLGGLGAMALQQLAVGPLFEARAITRLLGPTPARGFAGAPLSRIVQREALEGATVDAAANIATALHGDISWEQAAFQTALGFPAGAALGTAMRGTGEGWRWLGRSPLGQGARGVVADLQGSLRRAAQPVAEAARTASARAVVGATDLAARAGQLASTPGVAEPLAGAAAGAALGAGTGQDEETTGLLAAAGAGGVMLPRYGGGRFYSRLQDAVTKMKQPRGPAEQMEAVLLKGGGFKREEYDLVLRPWFEEAKAAGRKISKEEILEAAQARAIPVGEVASGPQARIAETVFPPGAVRVQERLAAKEAEVRQALEAARPAVDRLLARPGRTPEQVTRSRAWRRHEALRTELEAIVEVRRDFAQAAQGQRTIFQDYVPGRGRTAREPFLPPEQGSYGEVVLQVPPSAEVRAAGPAIRARDPEGAEAGLEGRWGVGHDDPGDTPTYLQEYRGLWDQLADPEQAVGSEWYAAVRRQLQRARTVGASAQRGEQLSGRTPREIRTYSSPHWRGVESPLGHLRHSIRTDPAGQRWLHIEEVQSDLHQTARQPSRGSQGDPLPEVPALEVEPAFRWAVVEDTPGGRPRSVYPTNSPEHAAEVMARMRTPGRARQRKIDEVAADLVEEVAIPGGWEPQLWARPRSVMDLFLSNVPREAQEGFRDVADHLALRLQLEAELRPGVDAAERSLAIRDVLREVVGRFGFDHVDDFLRLSRLADGLAAPRMDEALVVALRREGVTLAQAAERLRSAGDRLDPVVQADLENTALGLKVDAGRLPDQLYADYLDRWLEVGSWASVPAYKTRLARAVWADLHPESPWGFLPEVGGAGDRVLRVMDLDSPEARATMWPDPAREAAGDHQGGRLAPSFFTKKSWDAQRDWYEFVTSRLPEYPMGDTEDWALLLIKRAIDEAVRLGLPGVSISRSSSINQALQMTDPARAVSWQPGAPAKSRKAWLPPGVPRKEDTWLIEVTPLGSRQPQSRVEVLDSKLNDYVGPALADEIRATKAGRREAAEGEELWLGGHGNRGFYDQKLEQLLKRYAKSQGVEFIFDRAPMTAAAPKVMGWGAVAEHRVPAAPAREILERMLALEGVRGGPVSDLQARVARRLLRAIEGEDSVDVPGRFREFVMQADAQGGASPVGQASRDVFALAFGDPPTPARRPTWVPEDPDLASMDGDHARMWLADEVPGLAPLGPAERRVQRFLQQWVQGRDEVVLDEALQAALEADGLDRGAVVRFFNQAFPGEAVEPQVTREFVVRHDSPQEIPSTVALDALDPLQASAPEVVRWWREEYVPSRSQINLSRAYQAALEQGFDPELVNRAWRGAFIGDVVERVRGAGGGGDLRVRWPEEFAERVRTRGQPLYLQGGTGAAAAGAALSESEDERTSMIGKVAVGVGAGTLATAAGRAWLRKRSGARAAAEAAAQTTSGRPPDSPTPVLPTTPGRVEGEEALLRRLALERHQRQHRGVVMGADAVPAERRRIREKYKGRSDEWLARRYQTLQRRAAEASGRAADLDLGDVPGGADRTQARRMRRRQNLAKGQATVATRLSDEIGLELRWRGFLDDQLEAMQQIAWRGDVDEEYATLPLTRRLREGDSGLVDRGDVAPEVGPREPEAVAPARPETLPVRPPDVNYAEARARDPVRPPSREGPPPSLILRALTGRTATSLGLGAGGLALSEAEDEKLRITGHGLVGLAVLHAVGLPRIKGGAAAAGGALRDRMLQHPLGRRALQTLSADLVTSPEVREIVRHYEREVAFARSRARETQARLRALGPQADRRVSDIIEGEAWEPVTGPDAGLVVAMAEQVRREFEELGDMLVSAGMLAPRQVEKYRGRYAGPRLYGEKLGEAIREDELTRIPEGGRRVRLDTKNYSRQDLSDEVRLALGEIREASLRARVGLERGYRNLAAANLFQQLRAMDGVLEPGYQARVDRLLAAVEAGADAAEVKAARGDLALYAQDFRRASAGYVKLPDSPGLGVLRSAVVREDVADYLQGIPSLSTLKEGPWRDFFRYWKVSHTVYNPGTQVGNFISNIAVAHMAGLPVTELGPRLLRAMRDARRQGPTTRYLTERGLFLPDPEYGASRATMEAAGGLPGGRMSDERLARRLVRRGGLEEELREYARTTRPATRAALEEQGITPVGGVGLRASQMGRGVERAYNLGDAWFRIAVFQKYTDPPAQGGWGLEPEVAAEMVRYRMVDYDTRSKVIGALRDTVSPFIIYGAKAIPMIVGSIIEHPIRWATLAASWGFIDQLARQLYGPVAEEDLPPRQRTRPGGYLIPGTVQLPVPPSREGARAVFDIGRWTPLGGLTGTPAPGAAVYQDIPGWPQFLVPSGPAIDLAIRGVMGRDPFTGDELLPPAPTVGDYLGAGARSAASLGLPSALSFHLPRVVGDLQDRDYGRAATNALGFLGARPTYVVPGAQATRAVRAFERDRARALGDFRRAARRAEGNPERQQRLERDLERRLDRLVERLERAQGRGARP